MDFIKKSAYLATILLYLLPSILYADPPAGYGFVDFNKGVELASKSNKKIFVYLGRYGCGFCEKTNKETFSNRELKQRYMEKYVLVYVDAESGKRITLPNGESVTEQQYGARLKALVTPYFIFLEPDGTPIFKSPGFKTVSDFIQYDAYVSSNIYKKMTLKDFVAQGG